MSLFTLKRLSLGVLVLALLLPLGILQAQEDDFIVIQGEAAYIAAPANWINLDNNAALADAIDQFADDNPTFANTLETVRPQIESGAISIYVIDPLTGFNGSVASVDVGVELTLEQMTDEIERSYPLQGINVLSIDPVTLPVGEVARVHATLDINSGLGGAVTTEQYQYVIINGTEIYFLSFAAEQSLFPEAEPIFVAMAESFGFGQAPADVALAPSETKDESAAQAEPEATAEAEPEDSKDALPDASDLSDEPTTDPDAETTTYSTEFVSVDIPSAWISVDDPAFIDQALELGMEANPDLGAALEGQLAQLEGLGFEVFSLDPITSANVNIIRQEVGLSFPMDLLSETFLAQYESMGMNVTSSEVVELPAGEMLRVDLLTPFDMPTGSSEQRQIQYLLPDDTALMIVTFSVENALFEDYEAIFQAIIESLQLVTTN